VLYGRDAEREAIRVLLEDARASRSGVLVLRGEAGIGKTALLEDARDLATDMHVVSARGVEAESELPFGALHQLMRPALGLVGELPAPQAAALRAALGLQEGQGEERFLVFAACLTLLAELAGRRATAHFEGALRLGDHARPLDLARIRPRHARGHRLTARLLTAQPVDRQFTSSSRRRARRRGR
jgi:AAA ATPase-like protein